MKFSEAFNIPSDAMGECCDPVLSIDTRLFIDPFLLYAFEEGHFRGSHQEVIAFFNSVFQIIARSTNPEHASHWHKAVSLLQFPEVEELCLGYTGAGTAGAGSRLKIARLMANGLLKAILQGKKEIRHFEEVQILEEGIGADRISDATAWIIRKRIAAYTKDICERFNVPLRSVVYRSGIYSPGNERWEPIETHLPRNPYNEKPVLLIPKKYLRPLPTINPDDFWSYCVDNYNETLRREYGEDIARNVDKKTIVDLALRHREFREEYLTRVESVSAEPYDFERDPRGLTRWYDASQEWCQRHPLAVTAHTHEDLLVALGQMIGEFERYVSDNGGWRLLWNDNGRPKSEEASQLLFLGIVKHYCKASNIDVSREANIGRGPVDFKFAAGYHSRVLLEVKLARNTKFWNGLEKQLPKYMHAEGIRQGYFMVVCYTDEDFKRIAGIRGRIPNVEQRTGYELGVVIIDARRNPPSASKL